VQLPLVQILVVVANIQVRILKAEVGKGFARTAIDRELVDPKVQINLVNRVFGSLSGGLFKITLNILKGNQVKIPELRLGPCGNTNETGDGGHCPGKSSLFLLTIVQFG